MSSKVKVFIAPSLDGFIADENDSVDFLTNTPQVEGAGDYGYTEFFSKIEAVLMGRKTFDFVYKLPKEVEWQYGDRPVLVFTTDTARCEKEYPNKRPTVKFVSPSNLTEFVADLQKSLKKDIYVDGGTLIRGFLHENLIDEITLTIHPSLLGSGAPLFFTSQLSDRKPWTKKDLKIITVKNWPNGLVQIQYSVQKNST